MDEARFRMPTYYGEQNAIRRDGVERPEFGEPITYAVVREAEGLRVVLGTRDHDDPRAPDILIERRPHGWAIFLHPLGSGDPSGYICFLDDGRSYVVPETGFGPTPAIELSESRDLMPELDRPEPEDC